MKDLRTEILIQKIFGKIMNYCNDTAYLPVNSLTSHLVSRYHWLLTMQTLNFFIIIDFLTDE